MGANWAALTYYLNGRSENRVVLSWSELARIVGDVPLSAINHTAWWGGDRPHTRAWKAAGFDVESKVPGRSVTFCRVGANVLAPATESLASAGMTSGESPDILLVTCVKSKRPTPAPAKDLYTSPLFTKQRNYAESLGVPWFILSAEWGIVGPDDWLSPYERYLPDTSPDYQNAWGRWVVARLTLLAGDLRGKFIEVHASQQYVQAIEPGLRQLDAVVLRPLDGLAMGERLAWYDRNTGAVRTHGSTSIGIDLEQPSISVELADEAARFVGTLRDESRALPPRELLSGERSQFESPGLYSWWVDEEGAVELSAGLGLEVRRGMIYAGLAGATRWPSGTPSSSTLWSRIRSNHLGSNHRGSTLRRGLGSILAEASGWEEIDELGLTAWMHGHLRVVAQPYADADTLGRLEGLVLAELNPPLNLRDVPPTELRGRLSELRDRYSAK